MSRSAHRCIALGLLGCLLWLTGCAEPPPPAEVLVSSWGPVITLGQAEQSDAPAVWPVTEGVMSAWIGADESGVHQDVRLASVTGLSRVVVLPLPPVHPYAQQIAPASGGNLHLLWLDTSADGQTRLYGAVVTSSLALERGPTLISDEPARRFAVTANAGGSLWAVTAGETENEPALFARYVDFVGRPRLEDIYLVVNNADWPTLAQTRDGQIYLFWISTLDGQVYRSLMDNGIAYNPQPITAALSLAPGDRLTGFNAALDTSHAYVFWNVTRADGGAESWMSAGALDAAAWPAPIRLGVSETALNTFRNIGATTPTFQTGFNTGLTIAAAGGDIWGSWATPLIGQFDVLPVAAQVNTGLAVLYLRAGEVVGYQEIAPVGRLIGAPALVIDRDRFLYLAWSQPGVNVPAALRVASLRVNAWSWVSTLLEK